MNRPPPNANRKKNPAPTHAATATKVKDDKVTVGLTIPAIPNPADTSASNTAEAKAARRKFYVELVVTTALSAAISTVVATVVGHWMTNRAQKKAAKNPDNPSTWSKNIVIEDVLASGYQTPEANHGPMQQPELPRVRRNPAGLPRARREPVERPRRSPKPMVDAQVVERMKEIMKRKASEA